MTLDDLKIAYLDALDKVPPHRYDSERDEKYRAAFTAMTEAARAFERAVLRHVLDAALTTVLARGHSARIAESSALSSWITSTAGSGVNSANLYMALKRETRVSPPTMKLRCYADKSPRILHLRRDKPLPQASLNAAALALANDYEARVKRNAEERAEERAKNAVRAAFGDLQAVPRLELRQHVTEEGVKVRIEVTAKRPEQLQALHAFLAEWFPTNGSTC